MSAKSAVARPHLRAFANSPWGVFLVAFVLTMIPMSLWNLASPIGSAPDEPSHFIRAAAVVRGEVITGPLSSNPRISEADVPEFVAWTHSRTCYAFKADVTAACVHPVPGDPDRIVESGHSASANSPGFYAITGLPSLLLSGDKALYAMRGMNSLMCAAMAGFIFMALSQLARPRWSYLAAFVSLTPMLLYLGGTINPNGVEALSSAAVFTGLTVLTTRMVRGGRMAGLLTGVVVGTLFLIGTRNISLLWALLGVGLALLLGRRPVILRRLRQPSVWIALALCALLCVAGLWYFLQPSRLAPGAPFSGVGQSFFYGLTYMIQHTFEYANGWIGLFGWVDTPAPGFALASWAAVMFALVVGALIVARGTKRWGVIVLLVAFVLVPAFSQAAVITSAGFIWQGRYTLTLVLMLMIAAGIVLDRSGLPSPHPVLARSVTFALWLLAFSHVYTFFVAVKRYVVGETAYVKWMFTQPAWQPPLGWLTLTIGLAVVAVAAVLVMTHALRGIDRRWDRVADRAPGPRPVPVT